MSIIQFTIATIDDAPDEVMSVMNSFFGRKDIDAENQLADLWNNLREDLCIGIEWPYVDRMYRNTYYTYFSSKHNPYPRDCIRLSLFQGAINAKSFRDPRNFNKLKKQFRGYIILRPTFPSVIGRTLIDPAAYTTNDFQICRYTGHASINGIKFTVTGFPFSSQDGEAITCAETTIWSVMEYFGGRYAEYQHVNPSVIVEVLNRHSKKRMIPSSGLTVDQISQALKEFGFGTQIYGDEEAYRDELNNFISIYVESGIPVIAALQNLSIAHSVVIIGHETDDHSGLEQAVKRKLEYPDVSRSYIDYSDIPRRYIVNDDNLSPYQKIYLDNPVSHYTTDTSFEGATISSAVVPLSRKIYLEVVRARTLALKILVDPEVGHLFGNGFIFRFFLTSSRSFKDHITGLVAMKKVLKEELISSRMPKFIWCAEIYTNQGFKMDQPSGLIIIDATGSDEVWSDSLLFAGYPGRTIVKSEESILNLPLGFTNYKKYISNLQ